MKKIFKVLLTIISFLMCGIVYAKTTYTSAPTFVNEYIRKFREYQRYIVNENTKYGMDTNGNIINDSDYKTGGLLNRREFEISKNENGDTYLFNGLEYLI